MWKSIFVILVALSSTYACALSKNDCPDNFKIKNSHSGSVILTANNQTIGALKMAPYKSGTYYFFDGQNQQQLTIKLKKIGYWGGNTVTFDIYDKQHILTTSLIEELNPRTGYISRFTLLAKNGQTLLLTGRPNFGGTEHIIYADNSWESLAKLTRPLLTWSRDSDVTILDKAKLFSSVTPNVFAAVLAVHAGRQDLSIDPPNRSEQPKYQALIAMLVHLKETLNVPENTVISEAQLKVAADVLNQRYNEVYDDKDLTEEDKIKQFIDFSCGLIQSHSFSPIEEEAMVQFLMNRLLTV